MLTRGEFYTLSKRKDVAANDAVHYFSAHIEKPLAYILYRCGCSPNQVSGLFGLVGLASALAIWLGFPLWAWLLWRLHIALDMADGSIARATGVYSKYAQGIDRSNHVIVNTCVLFGIGKNQESIILICGLIVSFYLYYFFSRNFYSASPGVKKFSVRKNVIKDLVSLEGFLAGAVVLLYFKSEPELITSWIVVYTLNFFFLFCVKLRAFSAESY